MLEPEHWQHVILWTWKGSANKPCPFLIAEAAGETNYQPVWKLSPVPVSQMEEALEVIKPDYPGPLRTRRTFRMTTRARRTGSFV
jgi:hypothetical protein